MNWLEGIIYGLVMGFTDILPISSVAHSYLLAKLFGAGNPSPVQNLLVHLAILIAVIQSNFGFLEQVRRQRSHLHRRLEMSVPTATLELRFFKNAILPMFILFFLLKYCLKFEVNLAWIALFSLINGILLFVQGRMMQGNKDARSLSILDSLLAGLASGLFIFPGISRISATMAVFTARGIDREKATGWAILLSIPALILVILNDFLRIFSGDGNSVSIIVCILSAVAAYFAGYFGIRTLKRMSAVRDMSGFSYYSWGVALFSFVLYLTVA